MAALVVVAITRVVVIIFIVIVVASGVSAAFDLAFVDMALTRVRPDAPSAASQSPTPSTRRPTAYALRHKPQFGHYVDSIVLLTMVYCFCCAVLLFALLLFHFSNSTLPLHLSTTQILRVYGAIDSPAIF